MNMLTEQGNRIKKSHCFIMFFNVFPACIPRMLLSGIHFNHGFPIKPSEMTIFFMHLKAGLMLNGFKK